MIHRWYFCMVPREAEETGVIRLHVGYVADRGAQAAEVAALWAKAKAQADELGGIAEMEAIEVDYDSTPGSKITTGNREYRWYDRTTETPVRQVTDGRVPPERAAQEAKIRAPRGVSGAGRP